LHYDIVEVTGWIAACLGIYGYQAKTMIPLRVTAVFACVFGFAHALPDLSFPDLFVNAVLLPLNLLRLNEMRRLIADSGAATTRPQGYDWLKPFMHPVRFPAGEVLFRKGEEGAEAYLIGSGAVDVPEHDASVGAGDLLGEIGMLTAGHVRTASAICRTEVRAWKVSFDEMQQLCLQNPEFCLHLARIIVQRYEANLTAGAAAAEV
jgi:CRP/FNR family cyclic AMP-dependent transcriptional regulator